MSLFGDDDVPPRPKQGSALFGDEPKASPAGSGLFADDLGDDASPWSFPTPKKQSRGNIVKSLLADADIPESYIDAWDAIIQGGQRTGGVAGGVSVEGAETLMKDSGVESETGERIMGIVKPGGGAYQEALGRGEFNVLCALVGLAKEGEDVTLDGVDERRRNLPQPHFKLPQVPSSSARDEAPRPEPGSAPKPEPSQAQPPPTPDRSRNIATMRSNRGYGFPEQDPWSSPDLHRGHDHTSNSAVEPQLTGSTLTNGAQVPQRTTSTFTTHSAQPGSGSSNNAGNRISTASSDGLGWGGYSGPGDSAFGGTSGLNSGLGGGQEPFGGPPNNPNNNDDDLTGLGRSLGGGRVAGTGVEEIITVISIPEKEGIFGFQHRNYQVTSARRNSTVVRRYSDFVWLLDCLHKRYPFRQLPLLPPKRVAINGNYLAADVGFVEKRRRGLARFANALVRHPVLCQEQLVVMFLTVPTVDELAVWRKQATISVQEEFVGRTLPPTLEDSLPENLGELFEQVRSGVRRSAEVYINLCNLVERLIKRNDGMAAEYLRFSTALTSLTEVSADTYAVDTNDVPLLNEGLTSTAKHLTNSQGLLEDEARAWDAGVLEDFKRQRDCLVSMRDLFERRDRLSRDNIPALERRIQNNETKLANIRAKPEGMIKPGEAEKVMEAIVRDKQSIVTQHARGVFIKECVRDELLFFQQSQYHISRLHQDWSQERVKYAELQADNWRGLSEEVEGMPLGD